MKNVTNKKTVLGLLVLGVILVIVFIAIKISSTTQVAGVVISRTASTCTMDMGPSSCGPYDITIEKKDGTKSQYQVAGFNDKKSEKYNAITKKVNTSHTNKTYIALEITKGDVVASIK